MKNVFSLEEMTCKEAEKFCIVEITALMEQLSEENKDIRMKDYTKLLQVKNYFKKQNNRNSGRILQTADIYEFTKFMVTIQKYNNNLYKQS